MALRLGEYVEWGEFYHSRRNATHGFIKLQGMEQPIHVDLTGDPAPELRGKAVRFEPRSAEGTAPAELPRHLQVVHPHQVGPTGLMTIERAVRIYPGYDEETISDLIMSSPEPPPSEWKRCLTLEWYSQNGRVLIEIADPQLWVANYADVKGNDESIWKVPPERESWAPTDEEPLFEGLADQDTGDTWYPGSDRRDEREMSQEEFIQELELMDDLVTDEGRGDSLHSFISESIPSGPLEQLSDEEAETALKVALAQLALRSVAVHVCEHYSARDALHYLRTVVADEGEYYPALKRSSFVQNYMTSEGCPACEAEFEKDYEELDAKIRKTMKEDDEGVG